MNRGKVKMEKKTTGANRQEKIWDYFQTVSPEVFLEAKPRMDFLIKQLCAKKNQPVPTVLNVGIGDGYFEKSLQQKGWDIYTLDPNEAAIQRMTAMGIKGRQGYIEKMPFENETFDFVVASEVLEHLTDAQRHQGCMEIVRVLKKGGGFLGTVPYDENLDGQRVVCPGCGDIFHRWGHQRSFDLKSTSQVLSEFFEVLEVRRTAFVSFNHRSFFVKLKMLIKLILAKCGEMIATPGIYFYAKKI